MPMYVQLNTWTERGSSVEKETVQGARRAREQAQKLGARLRGGHLDDGPLRRGGHSRGAKRRNGQPLRVVGSTPTPSARLNQSHPSVSRCLHYLATARRLCLIRQHLAGPPPQPNANGMLQVVRDLGYL